MRNTPVLVYAKRTPVGKVGGILKQWEPEQLVAPLLRDAAAACGLNPADIDEVILGNVIGPGGNIARLAALTAGFPVQVPGVTVDRQCGAGLEAVQLACRLIQAGAGEIYFAGGVESSSRAPWKIEKPGNPYQQLPRFYGRARFSPESIGDPDMGEAAENVAEAYRISRKSQDEWALRSHRRLIAAQAQGLLAEQILPLAAEPFVLTESAAVREAIVTDECPRRDTDLDKLARLRPVFRHGGTVTAGNACPINDGAALVVVMSEDKARALGLKPLLRFVDSASAGVDPHVLGIGPVPAVQKLLQRTGLSVADLARIEFNEAFAAQVLASIQTLQLPEEKVNMDGGALAVGHPYGASGAILVVSLAHGMKRVDGCYGLATLGIGGGMGLAALFEKVDGVNG